MAKVFGCLAFADLAAAPVAMSIVVLLLRRGWPAWGSYGVVMIPYVVYAFAMLKLVGPVLSAYVVIWACLAASWLFRFGGSQCDGLRIAAGGLIVIGLLPTSLLYCGSLLCKRLTGPRKPKP